MPQVWIYNQHTSCLCITVIIDDISLFFKLNSVHDASVISLHFFFICRQLPAQPVHLLLLHIVKLVLIHCPAFFAIHFKFLLELC